MSKRQRKSQSIRRRIQNQAKERGLHPQVSMLNYVAVAFLDRLGRSPHRKTLILKGGHLLAAVLDAPHRATRDVDVLHHPRHTPDRTYIRSIVEEVIRVDIADGVTFGSVKAEEQRRADGHDYDGVKVYVAFAIENSTDELPIDVGFGDVVEPPPVTIDVHPFLELQARPSVYGYPLVVQVAEKAETMLAKLALHRLKDILDVVQLADRVQGDPQLDRSFRATFTHRGTTLDGALRALEQLAELPGKREWDRAWAQMVKDKGVVGHPDFRETVRAFDAFVRPLLERVLGAER